MSGISNITHRTLTVDTTTASTAADTDETDLWVYSMPANTLGTDGKSIKVVAWGTVGANANSKQMRLYLGTTNLRTITTTGNGISWRLEAIISRTGASAETANAVASYGAGIAVTTTAATEDTTTALDVKVTGQNGTPSAGDITFSGAVVELIN